MKFRVECEDMDGLVLVDKSVLNELDSDLLYSMEILLDRYGKSELIYDFPNEKWDIVRERETKLIKEFCNSGKMIVWLSDYVETEYNFEKDDKLNSESNCLFVSSGTIIMITASELIQCVLYPELEMEELFELNIENGRYAISSDVNKFTYVKIEEDIGEIDNVRELLK